MFVIALLLLLSAVLAPPTGGHYESAQARGTQKPAPAPAPAPSTFFTSTLPEAELRNKQAVLDTTLGTIVIDLLPEAAPNHVAHFITRAREGAYDGTTFHRVVTNGIIQGGDPLSKDPAQSAKYGTGGLRELRFEANKERHTRGAVSAVLVPGNRDSAGSQFFISVTDQPALDGQYTVFGRVVDGINVAQKISMAPATASIPSDRLEIRKVTIRDKPAPAPEPFLSATADEMAKQRVVFETSLGNFTVALFPDKAPNHVRQFLRLAASGVYDGTAFHRVVPGFVVQGGYLATRTDPLDERQQSFVRTLQPEFNDTKHDRGILSMARGAEPASATTSFFVVLGPADTLDGKYTAFGRVVDGIEVIEAMEVVGLQGETPIKRIDVTRARVVPAPASDAAK
jgi:peptidyl-prolyl cis-trans isomerase B (cyclophilin B)